MIILGCDPGTVQSALVWYDSEKELILDKQLVSNRDVVQHIKDQKFAPRVFAIEYIKSYGMSVGQTTFDTCIWCGIFDEAFRATMHENSFIVYVPRKAVCKNLCNNGNAKDPNISRALKDRLGEPGRKASPGKTYDIKKDLWSALAVAVTCSDLWGGNNNFSMFTSE